MSSKQTTRANARKIERFTLVYDGKTQSTLHANTDKLCWAGHMRPATPDELKRLAGKVCKHCITRVVREAETAAQEVNTQQAKREPLPRHGPQQQPQAAEPELADVAA